MECENRSSKGSFLQLFDWNVKSRKKLFSNKSELSENSKQEKENFNDLSRLHLVHEKRCMPNTRESHDLRYVASENDDEKGTKAPGVVARLMGLDSLPTSNVPEPSFTPSFDSHSFRDPHYSRGIPDLRSEEQIVIYNSMRNKLDGFTKNPVDLMLQKVHSRPIERFQTEILPPKSAKPISITHHKLLSPIKSPGFIPTMNTAYLMDTAAKIIEQSPRLVTAHKLSSLGSSPISLRIRDLKEKAESSQKSLRILDNSQKTREPNNAKFTKKQHGDRRQCRTEAPDLIRSSSTMRKASNEGLKGKKKSISTAIQVKATVQKRDALASVVNWSSVKQKEQNEIKHGSLGRNQQKMQKNAEKRSSMNKQSDVLRQNNQKQNCGANKEKDGLRPSVSHQKERKSSSATEISKPTKTVNRIVISTAATSRKSTSFVTAAAKDQPSSTRRRSSKKPHSTGNSLSDGSNNAPESKDERSIKCNSEADMCTKWNTTDPKNCMDVVSFTFTSPIKKSVPESGSSGQRLEKTRNLLLPPNSFENHSSIGMDLTGGDALSMLLEEKLKEFTTRVDTSNQDLVNSRNLSSSADSFRDSVPTIHRMSDKLAEHQQKTQFEPNIEHKFDPLSNTELWHKGIWKWQGLKEVDDHIDISNNKSQQEPRFQCCGPVSSLEPSYSECSHSSMDSGRIISSWGNKKCVSVETPEIKDWSSIRNNPQEADNELVDSASSTSFGTTIVTDSSSIFSSVVAKESSPWELEYIRCLLVNGDLRLEELALVQAREILDPYLFDQQGLDCSMEENLKLERKVLFDYVGESLYLKCVQHFGGSRKHWSKLVMLSQRTDLLAEELYTEVSTWTSMEDLKVDELVDKDMSTQLGKWVDFEIEAFEEGIEIEKVILTHLVDELVDEFFWS